MPRYIDADDVIFRLLEYRKLNIDDLKNIHTDTYRDMSIADMSMSAFYGKLRDLLKDLVTTAKYEERIEVIDLMCVFIEELAEKSTKGDDNNAGSI